MIVQMAKVEIIGPRPRLLEVLAALSELEALQLDGSPTTSRRGEGLRHLLPDPEMLATRLRFETLRERIAELCRLLPFAPPRITYLNPATVLPSLETLTVHHLDACRQRQAEQERWLLQALELERQIGLLLPMLELIAGMDHPSPLIELIGVTLRDPGRAETLRQEAERLTAGRVALATAVAADGTLVGVLAAEHDFIATLRTTLAREQIAELDLPPGLRTLPLEQQVTALHERQLELRRRAAALAETQERFGRHWLPLYQRAAEWLDEQLNLLRAAAAVGESEFCFFLHGWMPAGRVAGTRALLEERFHGEILLHERELRSDDLARAPVALRNPAYFRPFERLLRLLPLPRYTSYDPTPFLGLFFPLFFGLMLGDAGYGTLLLALAFGLRSGQRQASLRHDLGGILLPCALSAMGFGLLFGECFGEQGAALLGLKPLLFPRSTELVTMLWFALSVGAAHVLLGLVLGVSSALRAGSRHEAWLRGIQLLTLIVLAVTGVSLLAPSPWLPLTPALIALGMTLPLLLLSGGLLAPLETLKTVGNIISYVRLMAIGLTSVLLAHVANTLGGLTGNIVAGILVAGTLHLFNLMLGVFAPTVHALRLHYVEFFSKFFEPGGQKYRPLEKRKG